MSVYLSFILVLTHITLGFFCAMSKLFQLFKEEDKEETEGTGKQGDHHKCTELQLIGSFKQILPHLYNYGSLLRYYYFPSGHFDPFRFHNQW